MNHKPNCKRCKIKHNIEQNNNKVELETESLLETIVKITLANRMSPIPKNNWDFEERKMEKMIGALIQESILVFLLPTQNVIFLPHPKVFTF